ncbi:hypothetical protein [Pseudanabaena sp. SR411]|uniref:hypothetical protein n=1 Tax=Pseudanabaena sp. SR411 TaxID=1980935 RepID=UPI0015959AD7|nr:hypothetical protein [Pseudanabaena sp. SR411]
MFSSDIAIINKKQKAAPSAAFCFDNFRGVALRAAPLIPKYKSVPTLLYFGLKPKDDR